MSKPIIRIHNVETNEIIDREMTNQEFEIWQLEKNKSDALIAELENLELIKSSAKEKLAALGLTPEEIAALYK